MINRVAIDAPSSSERSARSVRLEDCHGLPALSLVAIASPFGEHRTVRARQAPTPISSNEPRGRDTDSVGTEDREMPPVGSTGLRLIVGSIVGCEAVSLTVEEVAVCGQSRQAGATQVTIGFRSHVTSLPVGGTPGDQAPLQRCRGPLRSLSRDRADGRRGRRSRC